MFYVRIGSINGVDVIWNNSLQNFETYFNSQTIFRRENTSKNASTGLLDTFTVIDYTIFRCICPVESNDWIFQISTKFWVYSYAEFEKFAESNLSSKREVASQIWKSSNLSSKPCCLEGLNCTITHIVMYQKKFIC